LVETVATPDTPTLPPPELDEPPLELDELLELPPNRPPSSPAAEAGATNRHDTAKALTIIFELRM
jgi:hypothetical protein